MRRRPRRAAVIREQISGAVRACRGRSCRRGWRTLAAPNVGDIRGRGLFLGLELVADRDTKAPLDPALRTWDKVRRAGQEEGLICYPGGGCIDGVRGDHVILSPPFVVTPGQLDELVEKLRKSLTKALR
jgi:adenosylmethionine-8-amino-7-oxononanoate aminotransferase